MTCEMNRRLISNPVLSMSSASGTDLHRYGGVGCPGPASGQSALERIGYLPSSRGTELAGGHLVVPEPARQHGDRCTVTVGVTWRSESRRRRIQPVSAPPAVLSPNGLDRPEPGIDMDASTPAQRPSLPATGRPHRSQTSA